MVKKILQLCENGGDANAALCVYSVMQTAVHLYNLPISFSSYWKYRDPGISNYFVTIYSEVSVFTDE